MVTYMQTDLSTRAGEYGRSGLRGANGRIGCLVTGSTSQSVNPHAESSDAGTIRKKGLRVRFHTYVQTLAQDGLRAFELMAQATCNDVQLQCTDACALGFVPPRDASRFEVLQDRVETLVDAAMCPRVSTELAGAEINTAARLCLDDLIPWAPQFGCKLATGAKLEDFLSVLEPFQLEALSQDLCHVGDLHPATTLAMSQVPCWDRVAPVMQVKIYVDGSFVANRSPAGWALTVLGRTEQGWRWLGYFSERLHEHTHPKFLGCREVNAHIAELAAMLHAMAVICLVQLEAEVVFDAVTAADITKGVACTHGKQLAQATAMMRQLAEAMGFSAHPLSFWRCLQRTSRYPGQTGG